MKLLQLIRAMLREIFDESQYERFCCREGLAQGRESYARFLDQRGGIRPKVKCC